jgi:hypothetical protein
MSDALKHKTDAELFIDSDEFKSSEMKHHQDNIKKLRDKKNKLVEKIKAAHRKSNLEIAKDSGFEPSDDLPTVLISDHELNEIRNINLLIFDQKKKLHHASIEHYKNEIDRRKKGLDAIGPRIARAQEALNVVQSEHDQEVFRIKRIHARLQGLHEPEYYQFKENRGTDENHTQYLNRLLEV